MTTILITQANGLLGRAVIDDLLAANAALHLRAAIRAGSDMANADPRVAVMGLDYNDESALRAAVQGVDKMLWQTPLSPLASIYTERCLSLAKAAGVQHIVFISTLHASPTGLQDIARQNARSEDLIRASGIPYTVLRSTAFAQQLAGLWPWMYEPQSDTFYSPAPGGKVAWLDLRDAAQAAAHALLHPETQNHAYTLTGQTALSLKEAVAHISQAVNRPLQVVCMDKEAYLERMRDFGADEYTIDSFTTLYDAISADEWSVVTDEYSTLLDQAPRPFTDFVSDYRRIWDSPSEN